MVQDDGDQAELKTKELQKIEAVFFHMQKSVC